MKRILPLIILLFAIPMIVLLVQQSQEIREKAAKAEEQIVNEEIDAEESDQDPGEIEIDAPISQPSLSVPTAAATSSSCSDVDNKFFPRLNLNYPGLEEVKKAYNSGNCKEAREKFVSYLKNRTSPVYFYDWEKKDELINFFAEKYPSRMKRFIEVADEMASSDPDVDWREGCTQPNPATGRCCTAKNASLNRFNYLDNLSRAYWKTKNEKYTNYFVALTDDWINDNPVPQRVINNKCDGPWITLNTGTRAKNFVSAYIDFIDSPAFGPSEQIKFLKSISDHAIYLYNYEEKTGYRAGNWQVNECTGLFTIATMFPEFNNSKGWRNLSLALLKKHMEEGIFADGAHEELTLGYHMFVASNYLRTIKLSEINGIEHKLPKEKLEKMLAWILKLLKPNKQSPAFGDAKRGTQKSTQEWLAAGALFFNRKDMRFAAEDKLPGEMFWIFGKEGYEQYERIQKEVPNFNSVALKSSQFLVMRTGWQDNDKYLLFDCAKWGGGHSHADALNIILDLGENEVIIDPGAIGYDNPKHHNYAKKSIAHNVVVVNNQDQAEHQTPTINDWRNITTFDYGDCSYTLNNGVNHKRKVFFLRLNYWIISDFLTGSGSHEMDLLYHFTPEAKVKIEKASKITKTDYITIVPLEPETLTATIKTGYTTGENGIVEAPYLSYSKTSNLPTIFTTILIPSSDISSPLTAKKLSGRGVDSTAFELTNGNKKDYFALIHKDLGEKTFGDLKTNGRISFLSIENNKIKRVILVNGTKLEFTNFKMNIKDGVLDIMGNIDSEFTACQSGINKVLVNGVETNFSREDNCVVLGAVTPPTSISLSSGWNQITWPGIQNYTAKIALEDIDNDCGAGTGLVVGGKTKDWWEEYVKNYGGQNFALNTGKDYHVNVSRECSWNP